MATVTMATSSGKPGQRDVQRVLGLLMAETGLNGSELAELLDTSKYTISRKRTGARGASTLEENLFLVLLALHRRGIDIQEVLAEAAALREAYKGLE